MRWWLLVCVLSLGSGCVGMRGRPDTFRPADPTPGTALVLVANGAGGSLLVSQNLVQIASECNLPWQVELVDWSLGTGSSLRDQVNTENQQAQGRKLVCRVQQERQAHPQRRIHLVGQSAGCAVVLAAAEQLPPDSVDRLVLLAPSVCAYHDLRPALRTAREGIDHFYSRRDRWTLGLAMRVLGTTDEDCTLAAGRVGFTPVLSMEADAELYRKLRQIPWDHSVRWTGNTGLHMGSSQLEYLRLYVAPLLASGDRQLSDSATVRLSAN